MSVRTLGRVTEKWSTLPPPAFEGWAFPLPPADADGADLRRYYLRVAVLHPQTEQTTQWTVACTGQAQWERYPIGSWLRLRVQGWWAWAPLVPVVRVVTIENQEENA
jgi:hypothetical protein